MDYGKHILVMIFTLLLVIPSVFSADQYQTFVPTLLPARQTELEALSWDTQEYYCESESESRYSFASVKLHDVDNLMSPRQGKISSESLFKDRLQRDALRACRIFGHFSSPVSSGYLQGSGEYDFSNDTLTFGSTKVDNVSFGCGHNNEGLFVAAAGMLGLGGGRLSFMGQAGIKFGNKFSYCLVNRWTSTSNSSSHLSFGDSPDYHQNAVYTPLVRNPKAEMFYYVGLEGISVGGSRVQGINASTFSIDDNTGGGGVIIDSGTSVTRLTNQTYLALRDAFRNATSNLMGASGFSLFDTCYNLSGMNEVSLPTVVLHFRGGADVSLPGLNYLIPVDNSGKCCFAFAGTEAEAEVSIIGNIQQQSFGLVFDLAKRRVGFAPKGCS